MRSATSFFDKTLFRSQLKHTWPLWLGYTALWLFLVPVMLFSELSAYQLGYSAADASRLLLNTGVRGGIFISFFFGLFFAMLSFSHLTQSRATNGFHALPVRRETIFLTAYLTGLFCQLSTILVTFLLGAAVSAPLHLSFWSVTAAAMGSAMLEAVFFYSFAALCMVMTGQILAAPVFYFVGNILVPGMEYLLRNFAGNFLYGYSGQTDVALDFLSPPLYMYFKVGIASIETCESDSYYVTAYALVRGSLMILAAYALAGLVIALIALLLYRTRKSEMTGSTVAFPWAVPVFKYGVAFCTAVSLGQFLYYFLFGQYRSSGNDSLPGTILCMAAGLVGYFVAEMLIKKSFRVFRTGAKGAAIVSLALVLLGVTMSFDLTGYEKRVPDESEIESAFYTFSGMTDVTTDDADTIRRLTAAHRAIVKNRNEQVRIADASDADTLSQSDYDDIEPFHLRLTYYLKDGSQLSRSYSLYLRRSDLTVPSSVTACVNALYMCRESVLRRVLSYGYAHLGDTPRFLDSYCYYYDENSNTKDYALTAAQAEQVYAALMQDVQDSDNGGSDIFAVQEYQYDPPISFWLELYFESVDEQGRPKVYTLDPNVNNSTPNTLQVLSELLPELKSNTVTPPSDDGIDTLPATEDVSATESVN